LRRPPLANGAVRRVEGPAERPLHWSSAVAALNSKPRARYNVMYNAMQ